MRAMCGWNVKYDCGTGHANGNVKLLMLSEWEVTRAMVPCFIVICYIILCSHITTGFVRMTHFYTYVCFVHVIST